MRIVKPYGRSHTEADGSGKNKRVLRLRPPSRERRDIEAFAGTHDELVIAQWISAIDKIATKPSGDRKPTETQREFRRLLGDAAWSHLVANGLLSGLGDPERRDYLEKLWRFKIAPYGPPEKDSSGDEGRRRGREPSPKGRWYARFAGDVEVADVDADAVVAKIHEHLYVAEYRISPDRPNKRAGRIPARAKSIAGNVLKLGVPERGANAPSGWSKKDEEAYERAGNVAGAIRAAAEKREKARRRVTVDIAGAALYEHYALVFKGDDGKPLPIEKAKIDHRGLFNLHMAVKDCYARILKHHQKDRKERPVSTLLPATMRALFDLVGNETANRDLNALVRLGKVIHYEASGGDPDHPSNVVDNWPADVTNSPYWTSDRQAEIKRNEAFVRVWRHFLALASRTLRDWADPEGAGDILLQITTATDERFDADRCSRKLDLLFGSRADLFKGGGDAGFQKKILRLALEGTAQLRHASFHFKGLGGFAQALNANALGIDADVRSAIAELLRADVTGRAERLRQTIKGAHFAFFFDRDQNRKLFEALAGPGVASLPLPRFRRLLRRAANAWGKANLRLPAPANRNDLENPARMCQYTALKLIYERPFRTWLTELPTATLNHYIVRAVRRATAAARDLNAKKDKDRRAVIKSRAASLGELAEDDDIESFFFDLSAATASEMRVQRGYESDADNAREQAEYIEDLKCDVLALALADFLKEKDFDFVLTLSPDTLKPTLPLCDLSPLPVPEAESDAEDWQHVLYFLVHLVPVDEIGRLLHQMRKWEILAGKLAPEGEEAGHPLMDMARRVQAVLELYLDMHDAKFEGGAALTGIEDFKELFESEDVFYRIFPRQAGADEDRHLPRRGLREIMRFGHLPVLRSVFGQHTVSAADVAAFAGAEAAADGKSPVARWQETRERLHEEWVKNNRQLSGKDLRAYVEALKAVSDHRHLAAQVTLTDHVRLHRLMMAVLGRLVDFSGLWERDLYFVALALIHALGRRPADVFNDKGIERLKEGRIVDALRNLKWTPEAPSLQLRLNPHFGATCKKKNDRVEIEIGNIRIRNDFAHFNMLQPGKPPVDLTVCVNDARRLMAYDRKLKNAVTQAIKELLHREGLSLEWTMGADPPHTLTAARLSTRQATHLGKATLIDKEGKKLTENLHGADYVGMAAALFGGQAKRKPGIAELDLDGIDWERSASPRRGKPQENRPRQVRNGQAKHGNRRRNRRNSS